MHEPTSDEPGEPADRFAFSTPPLFDGPTDAPAEPPNDAPHNLRVAAPSMIKIEAKLSALQRITFIAALVIILAGIKAASSLLVPILLGCFIAIISWPLVALVRKTRLPDGVGIVLVLVVIISSIIGIGATIVTSATGFVQISDVYAEALTVRFSGLIGHINTYAGKVGLSIDPKELQNLLNPGTIFSQVSNVVSGVGAAVSNFFYVLVLLSFIIVEISILPKKLEALTTSKDNLQRFQNVVGKVQTYIVVKTSLSVATSLITGIATFAVGVPYPGLWMLLTFVLNYIPAFGSILAAVPPVLLALLLISWPAAIAVAATYLVVNFFFDNMLEPRLMGRTLGLSPLVVFVSLVFWGWLLGPIGMPLSTPLTMVVKIMLEGSVSFGWIAVLLSSGTDETPEDRLAALHDKVPALRFISMTDFGDISALASMRPHDAVPPRAARKPAPATKPPRPTDDEAPTDPKA